MLRPLGEHMVRQSEGTFLKEVICPVELTSKHIKLTVGIVLVDFFGSLAAGLGLIYFRLPKLQCSVLPGCYPRLLRPCRVVNG